jgi:hypothetical protein
VLFALRSRWNVGVASTPVVGDAAQSLGRVSPGVPAAVLPVRMILATTARAAYIAGESFRCAEVAISAALRRGRKVLPDW